MDDRDNLDYLLQANLGLREVIGNLFSPSGQFGRPISMLSFSINALLSQDIFYWKLSNLVIHLACGLLIYGLTRQLLYFDVPAELTSKSADLSVAVCLLWLLHPLHVSTVLYTVQRMTQLSTLFLLAALLCYLAARRRQLGSKPYLGLQAATWFVLFPLAVFSKENGLLFPIFVLLFESFLIQGNRVSNKQMFLTLGIGFAIGALYLANADWLFANFTGRNFTMWERLLTESRVVTSYIGMLVIPIQQHMSFVHDDFSLSKGLFEPATTIVSLVAIGTLIGLAFFSRTKQPMFGVGILFFFIGHLMESTVFPLEIMFEHRNYLPSIGIFLALTSVFETALHGNAVRYGLFWSVIALFALSTWLRAGSWSSEDRLLQDLERYNPRSERLAVLLADQAAESGQYENARNKLVPLGTKGAAIKMLSIECLEKKSLSDGQLRVILDSSTVVDTIAVMAVADIANLGLDGKCSFSTQAYISWLDDLLSNRFSKSSNRQIVMMYKAHYLWRQEKRQNAIDTLKAAFSIDPSNPTPLFLACEWSLDQKLTASRETCPHAFSVAKAGGHKFVDLNARVQKRYDQEESGLNIAIQTP